MSEKSCSGNQNTHFAFSNFFLENLAVYEIMCKYMVEPDRPQVTWRIHIAYWTIKATDLHLECVIIIASPQQQWLQERSYILGYT